MSLIGSIGNFTNPLLSRLQPTRLDAPESPIKLPDGIQGPAGTPEAGSFGKVFEQLVSAVDAKQDHAAEVTREVLLGNNDQLHQSVIAMQEASVAFQLMVEVRNKVVESYQELMRMPV